MIEINNLNNSKPYDLFQKYYDKACINKQSNVDAILVSSFNKLDNEVHSRFVNLKYIINNEWIFFSNYQSQKSKDFDTHNQIAANLYWNSIDLQIRIKANIFKTKKDFSDIHFKKRSHKKNILALSSMQSKTIDNYNSVLDNYNKALKLNENNLSRPEYWGGYSFIPYYFEFWSGDEYRLNKREVFENKDGLWNNYILQP